MCYAFYGYRQNWGCRSTPKLFSMMISVGSWKIFFEISTDFDVSLLIILNVCQDTAAILQAYPHKKFVYNLAFLTWKFCV